MKTPERRKIELAINALEREVIQIDHCIHEFVDDEDNLNGTWAQAIEDINEVIAWIKCRECVVNNDNPCSGDIQLRSLFMDQLEIPACEAHYEDMQKVKIED